MPESPKCHECDGSGRDMVPDPLDASAPWECVPCSECDGTGVALLTEKRTTIHESPMCMTCGERPVRVTPGDRATWLEQSNGKLLHCEVCILNYAGGH